MNRPAAMVYVIDDDRAVRDSLCALFDSVPLAALCFESAQEFLAVFDPSLPGCLVLDYRMPGTDGLELQKQLRAAGCEIPVIFISGHGGIDTAVAAMRDGADDFLPKPFDQDVLVDRVQEAIFRDVMRRQDGDHAD
jgi:FixJ family two-component response regulator